MDACAQVPVPLAEDVDPVRALSLAEQPERFPGVAVESRPVRDYPRPLGTSAAQVLGYLGPVRADEVGTDSGLVADDLVGRAGLEQQYDAVLRGTVISWYSMFGRPCTRATRSPSSCR